MKKILVVISCMVLVGCGKETTFHKELTEMCAKTSGQLSVQYTVSRYNESISLTCSGIDAKGYNIYE